jgi:hypothetical protein
MTAGVVPLTDGADLPGGPDLSAAENKLRWLAHPYANV